MTATATATATTEKSNILEEALQLITYDRRKQYGPVRESFDKPARLLELMLDEEEWSILKSGKIPSTVICKSMIAVKIARQSYQHKRDNLVDLACYTSILNTLKAPTETRESVRRWRIYRPGDNIGTVDAYHIEGLFCDALRRGFEIAKESGSVLIVDTSVEIEVDLYRNGGFTIAKGPDWVYGECKAFFARVNAIHQQESK